MNNVWVKRSDCGVLGRFWIVIREGIPYSSEGGYRIIVIACTCSRVLMFIFVYLFKFQDKPMYMIDTRAILLHSSHVVAFVFSI